MLYLDEIEFFAEPTILFYSNGVVQNKTVGFKDMSELSNLIEQLG